MEKDPNGKDPHEPGAKLDAGKVLAGLMHKDFSRALYAVAEVTTYGARKYTPGGWLTVPNGFYRYTDAMHRHLLLEQRELRDKETELFHAAHAAWNALARLELLIKKQELQADMLVQAVGELAK